MWPYTEEENDFVSKKNDSWSRQVGSPSIINGGLNFVIFRHNQKGDHYE